MIIVRLQVMILFKLTCEEIDLQLNGHFISRPIYHLRMMHYEINDYIFL